MMMASSNTAATAAEAAWRRVQQQENDDEAAAQQQFCEQWCNATDDSNATNTTTTNNNNNPNVVRLKFLTHKWGAWIEPVAANFAATRNQQVQVDVVQVDIDQLSPDIINEAASQTGLYDGFLTPPTVAGSVVGDELQGWADLTPFIHSSSERIQDWSDILLGYRLHVAQYRNQIILYPLDGDILHLFYRKDVLQQFNLTVPRTWEEYNQVAAATHGKVFPDNDNNNNITTLTGSCVGRVKHCAGAHWANLIISSLTQTAGAWSGHLLDTTDLTPLLTTTAEQALQWMEEQVKYGPEDEFDFCIEVNLNYMHQGQCVLTYNWGNSFKGYLQGASELRGKFGVAPTPGSKQVLDRTTMQLVDCDKDRCPYAQYYPDLGWVNRAPYMAFGGWACAVNNYTDSTKKRLATEFCAFAASKEESIKTIIPNATFPTDNGQDPFRRSHLNVEDYVAAGYERETAQDYIEAIMAGLGSQNVVTDIRFPTASDLNSILDQEFHDYLNATKHGLYPTESERAMRRRKISERITQKWLDVINAYDSQGSTQVPILETYQKLRGVYVEKIDMNQINSVRGYGYALVSIILLCSVLFAAWTIRYRKANIVRASQPFFLVLICFGTIVFGSAIFVFGIDDSEHSVEACSRACKAMPWLLAMGWSIIFSALFAKIWRVNIVYKHSQRFKRLKVSERDVLLPFAIIFTINLTLLLTWTLVDPLYWTRVQTSATQSYGKCTADPESTTWKVLVSLLGAVNGAALIMANFEAYKARHMAVEFGESKYIAMAMASILQVVIVAIPLLFLVESNPSAKYFIWCSFVFIICMSILLLIFVPKIMIWWKKSDQGRLRTGRAMNRTTSSTPSDRTKVSGLSFRVIDTNPLRQDDDFKLVAYKSKVTKLKQIMQDKGIDADTLFREAGLVESESETKHDWPAPLDASVENSLRFSSAADSVHIAVTEGSLAQVPEEDAGNGAEGKDIGLGDDRQQGDGGDSPKAETENTAIEP